MDLSQTTEDLIGPVRLVVHELTKVGGVSARDLLLVGAQSRDILHAAFGHSTRLRATHDLDFGIAVSNEAVYEKLLNSFESIGGSPARIRVATLPVDIIPFGSIEEPPGLVTVSSQRIERLSVDGFSSAAAHALTITLDEDLNVQLPDSIGYITLKCFAACERTSRFDNRDLPDLVTALTWHASSTQWLDEVYDSAVGQELLANHGWVPEAAIGELTGQRVRERLTNLEVNRLTTMWSDSLTSSIVSAVPAYLDASVQVIDDVVAGFEAGLRRDVQP